MTTLTTKQLLYFDALAQTLHFGRAAELAGVTQPALSAQIAELEQKLGCRLFERGGRSVRLTEEATALQPRIEAILVQIREVEALARRGRLLLEDALRTASLPGQGGALVLVRRLRLPAFRACATPQSVAIVLEAHCRNLAPLAVSGRVSDEVLETAGALRFHDVSHACRELTDRLLGGERPRAWCWSLALRSWPRRVQARRPQATSMFRSV